MMFPAARLALLLTALACAGAAPQPLYAGPENSQQTDSAARQAARLHLLAGISAGLIGGGIAALAVRPWNRPERSATVMIWSTAGATGAGVAKEIADLFGFGQPSVSDAVITGAGGFAVAGLLAGVTAAKRSDTAGTVISATAIAGGALVSVPVVRELVRRLRE